jgi:hypothetical protein
MDTTGVRLTAGQRCTRAVLVLLGGTVAWIVPAADMPWHVRLFAVGLALLFLHAAANGPAIAEPRLSFRKPAMSPLPRVLLVISETVMALAMGCFVVDRLVVWLA